MRGRIQRLFFAALLLVSCHLFQSGEIRADEGSNDAIHVSFENALLSIEAENVPLEAVLAEVRDNAGLEFTTRTASVATDILSVSLNNIPLKEALHLLLKNYSYAIEEALEGKMALTILTSEPSRGGTRVVTDKTQNSSQDSSMKTQKRAVMATVGLSPGGDDRPRTLDECELLPSVPTEVGTSGSRDAEGGVSESYAGVISEAQRRVDEARIKRAGNVLGGDRCTHLWREVIEDLRAIQDPRATALLADIAAGSTSDLVRERATEALWLKAADTQFTDAAGMNALRQLANSDDPNVRLKALEALADYQRYTNRTDQAPLVQSEGDERSR